MAIIFFMSVFAKTNRLPFDLSEVKTKLVAGYKVEYSSMGFALFFLGKYDISKWNDYNFFWGSSLPHFGFKALTFVPGFFLKVSLLLFCFFRGQSHFTKIAI